jgi:hypothetical protein
MRTFILTLLLLVSSRALAVPIDVVVPAISPANTGAQMSIIASGLGSPSDIARFPGNVDVSPIAYGTDWIRVRVPETWSGNVQAYNSSTGQWTSTYPIEITFAWADNQWATGNSQWKLNSAGAPGVGFSATEYQCRTSYNTWECASDFTNTYLGSTTTGPVSRTDGENVLGWTTSGWSSGTIAVCSWVYGVATGDIWEFDIGFNAQHFQWGVGVADKMDISNIATHELGHSIGFLDQYGTVDFNETMYGFGANGETLRRTLHVYDVVGAEYVYGHAGGRANQTYGAPAGWHGPISPRNTADATTALAPLPSSLSGGVTTYVSMDAYNNGGDCLAPESQQTLTIDGTDAWYLWWGSQLAIGAHWGLWRNHVVTVPGGLHTFGIEYDTTEELVESNEADNYYEEQFAYTPQGLLNMIPVVQGGPPERGVAISPNADGYSGTTSWWAAVATMPLNVDDDYDTYVYDTNTSPMTGFRNVLESTFAGAGNTDFVVMNGNVSGFGTNFHVGIVEYTNAGNGNVVIQSSNAFASTLTPATDYGMTNSAGGFVMGGQDILRVHELYLGDTATTYDIWLDNLSAGMDLDFRIFGPSSATYNQFESVAFAFGGGAGGDEHVAYQPATAGYFAVVVYKPQTSGYGQSGMYELRSGVALSNLDATATPTGWFLPVTPRIVNNSTTTFAPGEPNLPGNSASTYINMAMNHEGTSATPAWVWQMWKDEASMLYWGQISAGAAHIQYVNINNGPHLIRGGRHTLSTRLDPDLLVPETNEVDNVFDLQLIWSPLVTTKNVAALRAAPPEPGLGVYPNSDGLAFTPGLSHSWVVAAAPRTAGDDYDVIAYSNYVDAYTGFSSELARSEVGDNGTDFVVGHFSMGVGNIYTGVTRAAVAGGAANYAHDQSDAVGHRAYETGSFTNQIFDANRIVEVYEALLVAGQSYSVTLDLVSGTDNIAFEVFSGAPTASGRGDGLAQSTVYNPTKSIATFVAPTSTWYPIVVYRTNGSGANQVLKYDLNWNPGAPTAAPGDPSVTRLSFAGASPNPAPGRTNLSFALPMAGPVQLEVFDLRGRRVRTLIDGEMSAGSHQIDWDGRDQRGQTAASGTYYLRLVAAGEQRAKRVTVVR